MRNPWLIVIIITLLAVAAGECNQDRASASGESTAIMDVRQQGG